MDGERLSFGRKLGYGLGDIFGGGAGTLIGFFYLVFLTDVVRLSPSLAGVVILVSKVYDAVTDPFEGVLSDRTRSRFGRRRPYLAVGIPGVLLAFIALFWPVGFASEAARFAWVIASYLFYSTVMSIVMLNYNALQAELTLDYDERTRLTTFRIFFSTVSSILCAVLPLEIVRASGDVRQGWIVMAVSFALFFALPFLATVATARERPEFQRPPRPFHWRQAFVEPFQVRTFVYVLVMYVTAFVAFDAVSSIVVYYVKTYLGRGGETSYVLGTLLVAQVASLPLYQRLSRRISKPRSYVAGAVAFVVVMFLSFLVTPGSPPAALYVFAALVGLGSGGVVLMVYAIFPDIPDVDELRSGERREGVYAALTTFTRKVSSAIAVFAVAQVLGLAGYVPPAEQAGKLVEQPQSDGFVLALRLVFVFLPVAFVGVGIVLALRFPLTAGIYGRLAAILGVLRSGRPLDPDQAAEKARLEAALIRRR